MAGVSLAMLYGYVFGQRQLTVTEHALPVRGWTGSAARLRIAQISDIHVGQNLSLPQLEGFVARVNALSPDLICVTGDIADSAGADCERFFPVLNQLRARFGVYAILGNHDHYAGADRVAADLLRWTDFRLLRDEGVTLELDGASLHVIGLDDRGHDWARGLASCTRLSRLVDEAPDDVPILLLSHRPDIFTQAAEKGVALTLSGHTHGGQIALPWFGGRRRNLAEFITPYDRGLHRRGDSHLYVNCGLGVTGQRIRLLTPREISIFEIGAA
jgi:predicted MPP superfamily phosphohydrolase